MMLRKINKPNNLMIIVIKVNAKIQESEYTDKREVQSNSF